MKLNNNSFVAGKCPKEISYPIIENEKMVGIRVNPIQLPIPKEIPNFKIQNQKMVGIRVNLIQLPIPIKIPLMNCSQIF